jgi:hypothetical protein
MDLDPTRRYCSFCGNAGTYDPPLVGGLGAFICGDCVDHYAASLAARRLGGVPTPPPWESMSDAGLLEQLRSIAQTGFQVEDFLTEWVEMARSRKVSWSEIAKALGIPRQEAQRRFA